MIDELKGNFSIRYITEDQYCSNYYCFIFNQNQHIIGVKKNNKYAYATDLLVNSDGQPLEFYNDRDNIYFDYDEKSRIILFENIGYQSQNSIKYQYLPDNSNPLIITNTSSQITTTILHEYYFEFRE